MSLTSCLLQTNRTEETSRTGSDLVFIETSWSTAQLTDRLTGTVVLSEGTPLNRKIQEHLQCTPNSIQKSCILRLMCK